MTQPRIRQQVSAYLAEHGAVEDPTGGATAALRQALHYAGSAAGFTQLIAAMDRSGELSRTVKGKRTYRIAPVSAASESSDMTTLASAGLEPSDIDYDELAAARTGSGRPHAQGRGRPAPRRRRLGTTSDRASPTAHR